MATLGFGADAFTISLVETAIRVSKGTVGTSQIEDIINEGKKLLSLPATPLPGIEKTLKLLKESGRYTLVLYTKGNPLDQENKLERSGLKDYFDVKEIVSNKSAKECKSLCKSLDVNPEEFAMVGNSMKSDILPVIESGGYGIYIPYHITWQLERAEECDSPRFFKLRNFEQVCGLLLQ
jgi:putative hydrolase of the HAD superfamily